MNDPKLPSSVHSVTLPDLGNNVYLVTGQRSAFIDSGNGSDNEMGEIVSLWQDAGSPDIAAIILTHRHRDHAGGAGRLSEATGGRIFCSSPEKIFIDSLYSGATMRDTVEHGEMLDLGGVTLEVVGTPGHTMGSISMMYREERVLFTGDTVLGNSSTVIRSDQGDMSLYLDSLKKLLSYEIRVIAPGHGPVLTNPRAELRKLIEHRLKRERQILELISDGRDTVDAVFRALYLHLDTEMRELAGEQIRSHVIKLEGEGRVVSSSDRNTFSLPNGKDSGGSQHDI